MANALKSGDAVTVKKDDVIYYTHVATPSADKFNWKLADPDPFPAEVKGRTVRTSTLMSDCLLADEGKTWLRGHVAGASETLSG